jgi:hypothetical protein
VIPTDADPNGLARRLQQAADNLDTAGDPSSSQWIEGFADDAYALESRVAELEAAHVRYGDEGAVAALRDAHAQRDALLAALEQAPQVVYDEIVEECGRTMAMAAAHAAKTVYRAAIAQAKEASHD